MAAMDATLKSFLVCALYGFFSTSITFFNKAVLASYAFKWPNLMTLFQMICSIIFLVVMRSFGFIQYPKPNWEASKKVAPLSLAFVGMVLTGLAALKYLNIPMFNTLRRATTLITMIGESYMLGSRNTPLVQSTVWLMIVGAMIAGIYDFDYSGIGYFLVAWNCVFTAAYLLYISKLGKSSGLNTFALMWYNNVQSLPIVVAICWVNGDFSEVADYPYLWDWDFLVCFIFQSALAFLLNYSIFLCTNVNSALATSVTGQIKNIATTAVGYFTFGDVTYNALNVFGLIVGVIASTWYSLLKFWESEANKKKTMLPSSQTPQGLTSEEIRLQQAALQAKLNDPGMMTDDEAENDEPLSKRHISSMPSNLLYQANGGSTVGGMPMNVLGNAGAEVASNSLPVMPQALGPAAFGFTTASKSDD